MPEEGRGDRVAYTDAAAFVHGLAFDGLPHDVIAQAQRCVLDLIGVAAAGSRTDASKIANAYAATQLRGDPLDVLFLEQAPVAEPPRLWHLARRKQVNDLVWPATERPRHVAKQVIIHLILHASIYARRFFFS